MGKKHKKHDSLFSVNMTIKPEMSGPRMGTEYKIDLKKAAEYGLRMGVISMTVNLVSQIISKNNK